MYICTNNLAPAYLRNLFAPRISNYDLRHDNNKVFLPKPRTDYVKRSFSYSGVHSQNIFSEDVRTANPPVDFKGNIYSSFADQYSHAANM